MASNVIYLNPTKLLAHDHCEDLRLNCPVCGGEYVHCDGHAVLPGYEDRPEADPDDHLGASWVKNGTDQLTFWCETGCLFALQFGAHEGNLYFRAIKLPET